MARLDLLLVPTHPDRSAGLGFLALFPATFKELVFALSCLAAATALEEVILSAFPCSLWWGRWPSGWWWCWSCSWGPCWFSFSACRTARRRLYLISEF